MNRLGPQLAAFAACTMLAACSVSPAGSCTDDSQCTAPAACDPGRHVCALPCEPKCGVGEVCLSAKCVQQGPVVRSVSAPATWTRRTGNLTVLASIDSGPNFKTASAALHVAGFADVAGTSSDAGAVRTYTFSVPASVQAAGSEAPVAFTIDAVDDAGHGTLPDAAGTGQLLIDDAPPQPGGVTVNGGVTGTDGLQWFKQAATGLIDAQVSVQDPGSGVNASTLKLMSGAAQLDNGTPQCAASTTSPAVLCHFFIDPHTPVVAAGGQGEVTFTVAGQDVAGNAMTVHQAKLGIDGKAPVITFVPAYPPAGADCNAAGVDPDNIFCGHDGSHFFRAGDAGHSLSFVVNDASGDVGSGADPTSGRCAIPGTTCAATFNAGGSAFAFPADFSAATFTSGPDGTGDVQVTVNATDLVGNAAAQVQATVHVTRVKWMRTMAGKVDTFKGSPIATAVPVPQVILAGSERDLLGPIGSVSPDGTVLWRTGHGDAGTISNSVAYSSTTKRLYVLGDNATKMFAYAVGPTGVTGSYSCALDDGSGNLGASSGAATLIGNGVSERALVADSGLHRLWAFGGNTATSSCTTLNSTNNAGAWLGSVNPPTSDGIVAYLGHDLTKVSNVVLNGGVFGGSITDASFSLSVLGPIALAGNLFFGNQGVPGQVFSYDPAFAPKWDSGTLLQDRMNFSVVIAEGFAFAAPASNDGHLHALDKNTGAEAWRWPVTATAKIGNVSVPTFGADGVIYFSSDNPKQLIPLRVSADIPSLATGWAEFKGSALQKTVTLIDTTVDSLTTEPVIDSGGVIYFGTAAGKVFALITDSGGPLLPVAGQTWPRVGFDNCNSSNTAFACQ